MNEAYPMPHADVPASQIFRAKDVRKSGMLRKKAGGFKFTLLQNPYDHRFVIIHNGWVYYYKNEKSEKQQGNFSLEGYSSNVVNAEEEEAKVQHVFKVYGKSAGTRIWYFAAENEMEKKEWMEAFRLEIERYKFAASTIKCSASTPCPRSVEARTSINERPKSINISDGAFNQMHRSPLTNFPSNVTIDTGFSSMSSSLGPEDDYEPVRQQKFTSEQANRHSADVTHMSSAWERGQEFIRTRPPEPLPHPGMNLAQDISGCQLDDVPRRPPPTPPKDGHRDMNSRPVGQSPKRLNELQQSNLPQYPGSPPFGFGVHKHNFNSSYAKNSAMPQFHLPPTISNQGKGGYEELQESPEYCDMDMPDEQPNHEVSLPKKPFNRYPIMPPMEEPSTTIHTGKSKPSQPHGELQTPSAQHSENLSGHSTQVNQEHGVQTTGCRVGQTNVKAKPLVPRKPNQLTGCNKGKPLPPAKPSKLQASHPPCGGVSVLRAAFESNQR